MTTITITVPDNIDASGIPFAVLEAIEPGARDHALRFNHATDGAEVIEHVRLGVKFEVRS